VFGFWLCDVSLRQKKAHRAEKNATYQQKTHTHAHETTV
jgi:hypothetical protein